MQLSVHADYSERLMNSVMIRPAFISMVVTYHCNILQDSDENDRDDLGEIGYLLATLR